MTVISTHPTVAQFVGVTSDKIVDFGKNGKFRVLVYGAYNAMGLIGPEMNGIAILKEPEGDRRGFVVTDNLGKQDSGYFGPSKEQVELFERIVAMKWEDFRALANDSERSRQDI